MLLGTSKSNLICEAGCGLRFHSRIILGSCSDHARIMLGSFSDHSRIVPALEMTFSPVFKDFVRNFAMQFCVAGAVFGDVGGGGLLLRALEMRFHM